MDICRFVLAHISESLAFIGLILDIFGVYLMWKYGAIAKPQPTIVVYELGQAAEEAALTKHAREVKDQDSAIVKSRRGLCLAIAGFGLQAFAQLL